MRPERRPSGRNGAARAALGEVILAQKRKIPGVWGQTPHGKQRSSAIQFVGFMRMHTVTDRDTVEKHGHSRSISVCKRLASILAVSLAGCVIATASVRPTLVEVWRGGDDALTQKLTEALESAFQSSPNFTLSSGKKPGTLVVTIPTHVGWKQIGRRTQVSYKVEFASADNQKIGAGKGSCWDDTLAKCVSKIVRDAEGAARRIH
jgi:hypothetical protein